MKVQYLSDAKTDGRTLSPFRQSRTDITEESNVQEPKKHKGMEVASQALAFGYSCHPYGKYLVLSARQTKQQSHKISGVVAPVFTSMAQSAVNSSMNGNRSLSMVVVSMGLQNMLFKSPEKLLAPIHVGRS